MLKHLVSILGKRALMAFGVVTFLVAALLATVNITSRYAIKSYVEDQLSRIPWDMAVYQTEGAGSAAALRERVAEVTGLARIERMAFLRARLPEGDVAPEVDGTALGTPWISLLAASDLSLLPPQVQASGQLSGTNGAGAVLALVGPERAMGKAYLALQGARQFELKVSLPQLEEAFVPFGVPLLDVIRLERDEINRWLMDQTGSISFVPHVGIILLMPYDEELMGRFEQVATGLIDPELVGLPPDVDPAHLRLGEYVPETGILIQLDRPALISAWDIQTSLTNVGALRDQIQKSIDDLGTRAFVDSTTLVLLERMSVIARLVGLLAILIALPLLWMGWVLAANLAALLMLNERRKLGLMRLRGIPGALLGRSLLIAISLGGILGGVVGLVAGSVIPLLIYEGGRLPLDVLLSPRQVLFLFLYLVLTLVIAFVVSRRLVRYATTISPLEASVRVAASEAEGARLKFGIAETAALILGIYTLCNWIFGFTLADSIPLALVRMGDRLLDFLGLPLFLYGVATLLASRETWMERLLTPMVRPVAGVLGTLAVRHISVKPHRAASFLLIVALMASVSLYPTITSRSFEEKAERGARVQMGSNLQLTFNSLDLVDSDELRGSLAVQREALDKALVRIRETVERVAGVESVNLLFEAMLPNFYLPGHGLKGVPLFLIDDVEQYLEQVYFEPELGVDGRFSDLIQGVGEGRVAVSPSVADFWRISADTSVLVGMDEERRSLSVPASGTVAFLAGTPPVTINDRQAFVQARIDYLNHLFGSQAYLVADANNSELADLQLLIPRVIVLVKTSDGVAEEEVREQLLAVLPQRPMQVHDLPQEIRKVGSDMLISLTSQNMRIYLVGGLLLALIAILSVAFANYVDERRTLALLRIRGATPQKVGRFFSSLLFSPALLGLIIGVGVSLISGYGLANYVWELREVETVVKLLPTHLVASMLTLWVGATIVVVIIGVAWFSSWWVFRNTALQDTREG